jgi:hypothetical protein
MTMTSDPKDGKPTSPFEPVLLTVCTTGAMSDYLAREAAHQARSTELRAGNKQALLAALAAAGVARLTVTFDGYGDSGQIESVEAVDAAGAAVPLPAEPRVPLRAAIWDQAQPKDHPLPLREAVEWFAYDLLGSLHGGWEINEGSYGEVRFDVGAAAITLDMNTRFTGSEQHLTAI